MRFIKLLSLAVVAAVVATAFVGAGSASAWGFCKSAEKEGEGLCTSPYTAGTIYTAALETGTMAQFTGSSPGTCKSAGFEFEQLSKAHALPIGEMEPVTFGNCNTTVAPVHLPWKIEVIDRSEGKGVWEAILSSSGVGNPGVTVNGCTYTAASMTFEFLDSLITGGSAKMKAAAIPLTGTCGTGSETMAVTYRVVAPAGTIYPG